MQRLRRLGLGDTDPAAIRVVQALVVAEFLQGIGASAVLPLLPLFLRDHGTSAGLVGAVMGAYFIAAVLTQYSAGHLADRIGHRAVILLGLAVYAVASVAFVLPISAGGYVGLRGLQGIGAGAVQVAGLALVGVVVPLANRGRAYSAVFAAQLAGMALGPLAGSLVGVDSLRWLFIATAAASLAAAVPILTMVVTPRLATVRPEHVVPLHVTQPLVGVALVGVVSGLVTGVYETCWSLLMNSRGAASWQIGLSWTLFAIPYAAFSPVAGRLADRFDRRVLAVAALLVSCGFAATYPFLPAVWLLMALGSLEAVGVAVAFPSAQSMLSQTAPPEALGRAQGLATTAQTAAIAVAAAISGAMFGTAHWLPFVVAAAAGVLITASLPVLWRAMPGHALARHAELTTPGAAEVAAAGALPGASPRDL